MKLIYIISAILSLFISNILTNKIYYYFFDDYQCMYNITPEMQMFNILLFIGVYFVVYLMFIFVFEYYKLKGKN